LELIPRGFPDENISIPADIRDIAICQVAAINGTWFEWESHAPILRAAGMSSKEGSLSRTCNLPDRKERMERTIEYGYDGKDGCPMRCSTNFAIASTERRFWYHSIYDTSNCVSRFLVALNVGEIEVI
jgi:hypothetical protein